MHKTDVILASYFGILIVFILMISCLNNPALAQTMMSGNNVSSSNGSNGMNSSTVNFANMFNGSSLFGSLGISMVDGVKVTGVSVLSNNNIVVTLQHITTNPVNTTLPGGVTVTATRVPMNLGDLMSAASAMSNNTANGGNNVMNMMTRSMQEFGGGTSTTSMNNPFAFLKSIQIGSSSIANPNWRLPQSVTMGLVGMIASSNTLSSTASPHAADIIIVSVIPFTGKSQQLPFGSTSQ